MKAIRALVILFVSTLSLVNMIFNPILSAIRHAMIIGIVIFVVGSAVALYYFLKDRKGDKPKLNRR